MAAALSGEGMAEGMAVGIPDFVNSLVLAEAFAVAEGPGSALKVLCTTPLYPDMRPEHGSTPAALHHRPSTHSHTLFYTPHPTPSTKPQGMQSPKLTL